MSESEGNTTKGIWRSLSASLARNENGRMNLTESAAKIFQHLREKKPLNRDLAEPRSNLATSTDSTDSTPCLRLPSIPLSQPPSRPQLQQQPHTLSPIVTPSALALGLDMHDSTSHPLRLQQRLQFHSRVSWKCPTYAVYRKAERIHDLYQITGELGEGGFARVYSARSRDTQKEYAVKLMKNQIFRKHQELIEVEVQVLAGFSHPHLVALHEVVQTNNFLVLVTELVQGGELFEYITKLQKFTEVVAKDIFAQIVEAVQALHEGGVVHRDLKPENILVNQNGPDEFDVKVADFGLASFYDEEAPCHKGAGTPEYSAPEVLLSQPHGFPCDIWSLGVVLYILLCGLFPFFGKDETTLKENVIKGKYYFPAKHWSSVSQEAKDLINKLLQVDPHQRPTIQEVKNHPWLIKGSPSTIETMPSLMVKEELLRFNATRKFRKSVFAIIIAQRLASRAVETGVRPVGTPEWLLETQRSPLGRIVEGVHEEPVMSTSARARQVHRMSLRSDLAPRAVQTQASASPTQAPRRSIQPTQLRTPTTYYTTNTTANSISNPKGGNSTQMLDRIKPRSASAKQIQTNSGSSPKLEPRVVMASAAPATTPAPAKANETPRSARASLPTSQTVFIQKPTSATGQATTLSTASATAPMKFIINPRARAASFTIASALSNAPATSLTNYPAPKITTTTTSTTNASGGTTRSPSNSPQIGYLKNERLSPSQPALRPGSRSPMLAEKRQPKQ
eukprot:c12560_g1_i1.p1 GENE.c12560_g1_i1~~c12560_g1_i1.p1  ORF type:complete len:735 (-),score=154.12 c12560_g1_i1:361-2565(-)